MRGLEMLSSKRNRRVTTAIETPMPAIRLVLPRRVAINIIPPTHPPHRHTGTRSTWTAAASAKALKSAGSEVRMSSPSAARQMRAASTASSAPLRPKSTPAFLPSSSSSALTSTPRSRRATSAWRPEPPRQIWAMTPHGSGASVGPIARVSPGRRRPGHRARQPRRLRRRGEGSRDSAMRFGWCRPNDRRP